MKARVTKLPVYAAVIACLGLIDSAYLWLIKITNNEALCIPGIGDCWSVNNSKYSEFYGIPISVFGVATYITILILILAEKKSGTKHNNLILAQFGITLVGFIFSLYLTYIQYGVLKAFCPFCLISALCMTALFVISIIRLAKSVAKVQD
ncbi:MAG TPA: vitamin K epoxide reductase family protein [Anaerolineaceae bacterium]|jgi:uncharacterized membrane protein|nr:vitamin K epoxide reductase family protein [Anaerolineaceae bacterium]